MAPKFIYFDPDVCECGVNWTTATSGGVGTSFSLAYGNGMFVVLHQQINVETSPDGVNWTTRTCIKGSWTSVFYANGVFVAVANDSAGTNARVQTSPDGITWTSRTAPAGLWQDVTYGNGTWVAVAQGSVTNKVMTSTNNGVSWTARSTSMALSTSANSIAYGAGLFVVTPTSGTAYMTSPDGITWTNRTFSVSRGYGDVRWLNDRFVAFQSGTISYSTTGTSWTDVTITGNWGAATYGGGYYFVFAKNNISDNIAVSMNGTTWTAQADGSGVGTGIPGDGAVYGAQKIVRIYNSTGIRYSTCTC